MSATPVVRYRSAPLEQEVPVLVYAGLVSGMDYCSGIEFLDHRGTRNHVTPTQACAVQNRAKDET
jgi:hypothetical protein